MGNDWKDNPRSPMDTGNGSGSGDSKIMVVIWVTGAGVAAVIMSVAAFLAHGYGLA